MKDLLEVLRVQRHNFLNHLQVISGLLQLKKYDRIMDYIIQVGNDYNQDSLVGRLEVPEIAAAIISSELAAGKQGINIDKKITTGLEKGVYKAEQAAGILKEILSAVISVVEKSGFSEREFGLEIKEEAGKYIFKVHLPGEELYEELEHEIGVLKTKAPSSDGEIKVEDAEGLTALTLKIPVCDNNTDK